MCNSSSRHSTPPSRLVPEFHRRRRHVGGPKPFSDQPGFEQETAASVEQSESEDDGLKVLIVEVERPPDAADAAHNTNTRQPVRVAVAMIRADALPAYITERHEIKAEVDKASRFLFLQVILSDYQTTPLHKGAGAALIEPIKRYGREHDKDTLYVDCWAGNDAKLNRYYQGQGFQVVGDFSFARASGEIWPGTLFRMHLSGP